jgi:hypothetical protein
MTRLCSDEFKTQHLTDAFSAVRSRIAVSSDALDAAEQAIAARAAAGQKPLDQELRAYAYAAGLQPDSFILAMRDIPTAG